MIEQLVMLIFIIACILAAYTFQFTFGKFIVLLLMNTIFRGVAFIREQLLFYLREGKYGSYWRATPISGPPH